MASVAHLPRFPRSLFFDIRLRARRLRRRRRPAAAAPQRPRRRVEQPPLPPITALTAVASPLLHPPPSLPQAEAQEPVDPKPRIEKECHKPCERQWAEYEKCKVRIAKAKEGSCEPWVFDYW